MSDDERSKNEADQRTLMALMMLVFVSMLLLALTALVIPALLGIMLVAGAMILFATAHYVVWGWWLPRYLNRRRDTDDE